MDFWERLKLTIKKENTTQEWVSSQIGRSFRTFRGWMSRKIMPPADDVVKIAEALHTTTEYLVTGKQPVYLSHEDLLLFEKSKRWFSVIDDLETISPAMAEGFRSNIHIAAEEVRGISTIGMNENEGKGA